jgi:hypothetical protein
MNMMIRAALLASLLVFSASFASAELTYTATATSSSGSLTGLVPGDVVTIDITLRSDADVNADQLAFGVGGTAINYDESIISYTSGAAASDVLVQVCIPATGCFGGVDNSTIAAATPQLSLANPLGPEVQFVNAASTSGSAFSGATDEGVITGVAGDPQFQLVFTVPEGADGETTIEIGASVDYGDALILAGGELGVTNSAFVTVTVPEPTAVASSAVALASVFGVIGIRRRS